MDYITSPRRTCLSGNLAIGARIAVRVIPCLLSLAVVTVTSCLVMKEHKIPNAFAMRAKSLELVDILLQSSHCFTENSQASVQFAERAHSDAYCRPRYSGELMYAVEPLMQLPQCGFILPCVHKDLCGRTSANCVRT